MTDTLHTVSVAPTDASSDAELISLSIAGNDLAFARIMRRYNRLLFRAARSILKNDDDTQDAVQEAWLRAWRALPGFRAEAKLSTWLVHIAVNEALGRLRHDGARPVQVVQLDASMEADGQTQEMQMPANPNDQPEPLLMRAEVRRQIEARIDSLPDAFRTVFMLRGVEEMSVEDVAQVLGIPEVTVRTRFFRARSLLREGLSRDINLALGDAFAFAGLRCDRMVAGVLARTADERAATRP